MCLHPVWRWARGVSFQQMTRGSRSSGGINAGPRKVSTEPTKQQGMPRGPLHSSHYRSGPVLNWVDCSVEFHERFLISGVSHQAEELTKLFTLFVLANELEQAAKMFTMNSELWVVLVNLPERNFPESQNNKPFIQTFCHWQSRFVQTICACASRRD